MATTAPTCSLWVNGSRFADGCQPGETPTDPVALSGLTVTWGRSSVVDQPAPSTCTFEVLDLAGGRSFRELLTIGAAVDVRAEASVWSETNVPMLPADPWSTSVLVNARRLADGSVTSIDGSTPAAVRFMPGPATSDPTGWTELPVATGGEPYYATVGVDLTDPLGGGAGTVTVHALYWTDPTKAPIVGERLATFSGAGHHEIVDRQFEPQVGTWVGLEVRLTDRPRWDDIPGSLRWDSVDGGVRWDDLTKTTISSIGLTAPSSSSYRIGTVFSGRITDLSAAWDFDEGGTVVKVTAEDQLAELANRYVGDTPWLAQRLDQRFAAIVAASGQAIKYTIDARPAALPVTWRDVDKKAATELLRELANSAGAPLWPSTSYTTGQYLTIEDIEERLATRILTGPPPIHIALNPNTSALELSACSLLLDPVEWVQSVEDNVTEFEVTWREQTLDDEGKQKPTDRLVTARNAALEAVAGRRRASVQTELSQLAPAEALANSMLARLSNHGWRITGLVWSTGDDPLTPADLNVMMTILDSTTRIGLPLALVDLPEWSPVATDTEFLGLYLEGLKVTFERGDWVIELLTSSALGQGASLLRWDDLDPTWQWDQFDPSVTWDSLYGVGMGS